jgi:hypothetical protein
MRVVAVWVVLSWMPLGGIATAQGDACDRECLNGIAEQYLNALAAKDPSKLPLASATVKFTENGQRLRLGDGLTPWTWQIAELFKVEKGLLHEIEAVLERVPYGMTSSWSSWEDGMSDKIQFAR